MHPPRTFTVQLPNKIAPKKETTVTVILHLGQPFAAYPKEIAMFQKQLVTFSDSLYVLSKYAVKSQKTTVTLPYGSQSVLESYFPEGKKVSANKGRSDTREQDFKR